MYKPYTKEQDMEEVVQHQQSGTYRVTQQAFEGPLDVLLTAIENKKLEISTVSLSLVTQDFLKYLDELRASYAAEKDETHTATIDIRVLVDFVSVASRLILIKSKSLLPDLPLTQEEEQAIDTLQWRLKVYQKIKPAIRAFAKYYETSTPGYARPYMKNMFLAVPGLLDGSKKVFYPATNITTDALTQRLDALFSYWKKTQYEVHRVHEKIISLEEHIRTVAARIQGVEKSTLQKLAGGGTKTEMVLTFLAVLHLARDQIITLEQTMHFSDIIINRPGRSPASDA